MMDAETKKQIDEKIKEFQVAHDEALREWNKMRGEFERAERIAQQEQEPNVRAYARAYECFYNERLSRSNYEDAHRDLVEATYIEFMDDDDGTEIYPGDQALAISRLLNGDD